VEPSPWALAAGPLAGGLARTLVSHWLYRATPARWAWDPEHVRTLVAFGRWVVGGTMVTFVAQQFHVLYLGKFLPLAILGVYQVAWSFCAQASKPLTVLANRVVIPHFAEFQRRSCEEHGQVVQAGLKKYLPACLLLCVSAGLFAPALFGFFYQRAFVDGGRLGRLLAVVVWFMVLQHVPRSALLSLGASRGVAVMALANALLTVVGIVAGYTLGGGSVPGAIWGNALGNVAGCLAGWLALRGRGLAIGRPMVAYSLAFLALSWLGAQTSALLEDGAQLSTRGASLMTTAVIAGALALWVWRRTLSPLLAERGR
jgi:O-antigen/teichoic acid export membrane protein